MIERLLRLTYLGIGVVLVNELYSLKLALAIAFIGIAVMPDKKGS